jgi:hypothetical protein
MYVDSYLIPVKEIDEVVTDTKFFNSSGLRKSVKTYEIKTNKGDFDVPKQAYDFIGSGDTITLSKSVLTNSIQRLTLQRDNDQYIFDVGFIRARLGMFWLPYLIIIIITNLALNKKLASSKSQKHLPYFWLVAALVLLAFHLNLEYLFK